jgi:hypothetical protein
VTLSALVHRPTLPGFSESVIFNFKQLAIIDKHLDELVLHDDAQSLPRLPRHGDLDDVCAALAFDADIAAHAVRRLVGDDVAFERVGAHDVGIVLVLVTEHQAVQSIDLSADRLESDRHIDVCGFNVVA